MNDSPAEWKQGESCNRLFSHIEGKVILYIKGGHVQWKDVFYKLIGI